MNKQDENEYDRGYDQGYMDAISEIRNGIFSLPLFLTVNDVMKVLDKTKENYL